MPSIGQGGVAQLGERCVRNAEVKGSNPSISISISSRSDFLFGLFLMHNIQNKDCTYNKTEKMCIIHKKYLLFIGVRFTI